MDAAWGLLKQQQTLEDWGAEGLPPTEGGGAVPLNLTKPSDWGQRLLGLSPDDFHIMTQEELPHVGPADLMQRIYNILPYEGDEKDFSEEELVQRLASEVRRKPQLGQAAAEAMHPPVHRVMFAPRDAVHQHIMQEHKVGPNEAAEAMSPEGEPISYNPNEVGADFDMHGHQDEVDYMSREHDKVPVAYMKTTGPYIQWAVTHPDLRRQGLGKLLGQHVLQEAGGVMSHERSRGGQGLFQAGLMALPGARRLASKVGLPPYAELGPLHSKRFKEKSDEEDFYDPYPYEQMMHVEAPTRWDSSLRPHFSHVPVSRAEKKRRATRAPPPQTRLLEEENPDPKHRRSRFASNQGRRMKHWSQAAEEVENRKQMMAALGALHEGDETGLQGSQWEDLLTHVAAQGRNRWEEPREGIGLEDMGLSPLTDVHGFTPTSHLRRLIS